MKKIYKISNHTKRAISALMIFLQMRLFGLISNSFNMSAVKDYHEIIEIFAELLHDEKIDDPQQIYEYYNYAMWNGYFSRNHKLQYTTDRDVYVDNAGMSIMSGSGVCLNYADMLSLIFKEMGFNSYVVMCYVDTNNIEVEHIRTDKNIERKIDSDSRDNTNNIFINTLTKLTGNHAITCVENNGELYFFDPTNFIYLNKTGINDVSIINGQGKFDLKYFTGLLIDNINIFKLVTYKNDHGYNEEVIEKQQINVSIEELEEFYNSQKENIENVAANNDEYKSILSMLIYSFIASLTIILIQQLSKRLINKFEDDDIKHILPKLKEYFEEKNIKTEFEVLRNYEIIEKELGIKDNLLKDLLKKSIEILETLVNNKQFHHLMLIKCLNNLGYNAYICYAEKYSSKFIKRNIPLIVFTNMDGTYIYDYETEELLYIDNNNMLSSLDGKYKYNLCNSDFNSKEYQNMSQEAIQNKINKENKLLTKEDIKHLRRTKTLRR